MPDWTLDISANCPRVNGEGITCQGCGLRPATGHVRVNGGHWDGRVILLVCPVCGSEAGNDTMRAGLVAQVTAGYLDIRTGGRGPNWPALVQHGDHWDEMDDGDHHAG